VLTSVEVSVTNLCNLRCVHCAVGELLVPAERERLPVGLLTAALDRAPDLATLSITGGEPSFSDALVDGWVIPLLQYARARGLQTQVNTHLTYPLERYQRLAPWVSVFHMTWNYRDVDDFARLTRTAPVVAAELYERVQANAAGLAADGAFVSAEAMLTPESLGELGAFSRRLAALGVRRLEVHPRYPVDFARHLPRLGLPEMRAGIERFLDERAPGLWVLFGTFPFPPCSPDPADRALWRRVRSEPGLSVRNDPDGRCRLNVDATTGDVRVTDFADLPPLGNIRAGADLPACFAAWQEHPAYVPFNCCCPEAACLGPNLIVAHSWFPGVNWRERRALPDALPAAAAADD